MCADVIVDFSRFAGARLMLMIAVAVGALLIQAWNRQAARKQFNSAAKSQ
jgi:hypothetical protein